jgi:hypothetical protein
MDVLARKIGQAVDGEDLFDAPQAESGRSRSICEAFDDAAQRAQALELIVGAMRRIITGENRASSEN